MDFMLLRRVKLWSILGCLLQPGLFYFRIQKSMREKSNPLIKPCATWTVPAAETKSIGLPADALVPCFLLAIWTISSWPKTHSHHSDLVPSRQFHRDQQVLVHLPGLAKNTAPRLHDWRNANSIKPPDRYLWQIPVQRDKFVDFYSIFASIIRWLC
jgi:hypothetical protein